MKLKTCSICNKETYLWKSNPKTCKICYNAIRAKDNTNQSNLPSKPKSVLKRIKSVSDKRLVKLAEYRVARDLYLRNHPVCEFYTCDCREVELHHGKGKIGELLTNPKYFKALCREHHIFVELKPIEAKELGLSFNRLDIP
jgi:hypothetical protein